MLPPLSPDQLRTIFKKACNRLGTGRMPTFKVIFYDQLESNTPTTLNIIHYPHTLRGRTLAGHWVALILNRANKTVYYFDPLSDKPDKIRVKSTQRDGTKFYDGDYNLTEFLRNQIRKGWRVDYSDFKIQDRDSESCGFWAILRLVDWRSSNDQFYQSITDLMSEYGYGDRERFIHDLFVHHLL